MFLTRDMACTTAQEISCVHLIPQREQKYQYVEKDSNVEEGKVTGGKERRIEGRTENTGKEFRIEGRTESTSLKERSSKFF